MASRASVIRCRAVSAPIVMSVPYMSLSIEPSSPTSRRNGRPAASVGGTLARPARPFRSPPPPPPQPQKRVPGGHLGVYLARVHQLRQQLRPLLAEPV